MNTIQFRLFFLISVSLHQSWEDRDLCEFSLSFPHEGFSEFACDSYGAPPYSTNHAVLSLLTE